MKSTRKMNGEREERLKRSERELLNEKKEPEPSLTTLFCIVAASMWYLKTDQC